jgi:hypothetical protein
MRKPPQAGFERIPAQAIASLAAAVARLERAADGIGQERWDPARAAGFPSVLIRICNVVERVDRCSCAPPKSSL